MADSVLPVINPATGAEIARLDADGAESIAQKVERARAAQPAWAALALAERIAILRRFSERLLEEKERLAKILSQEMGKPIVQARNEIGAAPQRIEFFTAHVEEVLEDEVVLSQSGFEERIRWEPLGVVAHISAWNYPYFVGLNAIVPALLTGNTVLYKPSEHASMSGLAIVDLLHRSDVPADVLVAAIGAGEVGAALLAQPLDGVFFTGSHATGLRVARAAAERMIRLQLELGGKDPVYVCDDVPLESAAASVAEGAFYNTGQSCCAVERVYVHRAIAGRFVDAFLAEVGRYTVGDPLAEDTFIGPLARAAQLDVLDRQVKDAVARGGQLLCGGERLRRPGFFYAPTVIAGANHSMLLMREESFGPIIGLQTVSGDEEAVALMNDTEYGLTAGVYTRDRSRAERALRQVNVGSAYWNCCDRVSPRLPWSGRKRSGIGVTLSEHGIRAFVQPKAWHLRG